MGKIPLSREGSQEGCKYSQFGGGMGVGGFGFDNATMRANGEGEEDPRERWFRQENSQEEIHILTCLEDDLDSSLLFEYGGGK